MKHALKLSVFLVGAACSRPNQVPHEPQPSVPDPNQEVAEAEPMAGDAGVADANAGRGNRGHAGTPRPRTGPIPPSPSPSPSTPGPN
jgi:hypothetical protein